MCRLSFEGPLRERALLKRAAAIALVLAGCAPKLDVEAVLRQALSERGCTLVTFNERMIDYRCGTARAVLDRTQLDRLLEERDSVEEKRQAIETFVLKMQKPPS